MWSTDKRLHTATKLTWFYMKQVGFSDSCCIASSLVLSNTCRMLGILAKPLVVEFLAATKAMQTHMDAKDIDIENDDAEELFALDGSWSVGVNYKPDPGEGNFESHLVVAAERGTFLCDPSLGQASRPERGLVLGPSVFRIEEGSRDGFFKSGNDTISFVDAEDGNTLTYKAHPADRSYKASNDYKFWEKRYGNLAAGIVQVISDAEAGRRTIEEIVKSTKAELRIS